MNSPFFSPSFFLSKLLFRPFNALSWLSLSTFSLIVVCTSPSFSRLLTINFEPRAFVTSPRHSVSTRTYTWDRRFFDKEIEDCFMFLEWTNLCRVSQKWNFSRSAYFAVRRIANFWNLSLWIDDLWWRFGDLYFIFLYIDQSHLVRSFLSIFIPECEFVIMFLLDPLTYMQERSDANVEIVVFLLQVQR